MGAHLVNAAAAGVCRMYYWRELNREGDFIMKSGRMFTAMKVESGRPRESFPGMGARTRASKLDRTLVVGGDGIPVEEFLSRSVEHQVKE